MKTQKEVKHTPTGESTPRPWKVGHIGEDLTQISIDGSDERLVSIVYSLDFSEEPRPAKETAANAEFIVQAVNSHDELLSLLKYAQARLFIHEGKSDLYDLISVTLDKAEGKGGN